MSTPWDRLATGQAVRVKLSEAAERKPVPQQRIVRAGRWSHYAGWNALRGGRPRCRAPGCSNYLRRDQPFACSIGCVAMVKEELAQLQAAVQQEAA
jgi:hypothetical protein